MALPDFAKLLSLVGIAPAQEIMDEFFGGRKISDGMNEAIHGCLA